MNEFQGEFAHGPQGQPPGGDKHRVERVNISKNKHEKKVVPDVEERRIADFEQQARAMGGKFTTDLASPLSAESPIIETEGEARATWARPSEAAAYEGLEGVARFLGIDISQDHLRVLSEQLRDHWGDISSDDYKIFLKDKNPYVRKRALYSTWHLGVIRAHSSGREFSGAEEEAIRTQLASCDEELKKMYDVERGIQKKIMWRADSGKKVPEIRRDDYNSVADYERAQDFHRKWQLMWGQEVLERLDSEQAKDRLAHSSSALISDFVGHWYRMGSDSRINGRDPNPQIEPRFSSRLAIEIKRVRVPQQ